MPVSLEERVAFLEGKVEEHSKAWVDLKDLIINLDAKVDRRIDALDQKVDRFREELSSRIDTLDQKLPKYFLWIIGVQVTVFLAIIGVLLKV